LSDQITSQSPLSNKLESKENTFSAGATGGKDDFNFLDSFFSSSNTSNVKVQSNLGNDIQSQSKNDPMDFDFVNKKEDKKVKTIFDGIKDNSSPNVYQFNSSGGGNNPTNPKPLNISNKNNQSSSSNNLNQFNFTDNNPSSTGNKGSSLNLNKNKSPMMGANTHNPNNFNIDFTAKSSNATSNFGAGKKDDNLLNSLLNDLPDTTGSNNQFTIGGNSMNTNKSTGMNNQGNTYNFGSFNMGTNTNTQTQTQNNQKNNTNDMFNFGNNNKQSNMSTYINNNFNQPQTSIGGNNMNDDYNLDFLKQGSNKQSNPVNFNSGVMNNLNNFNNMNNANNFNNMNNLNNMDNLNNMNNLNFNISNPNMNNQNNAFTGYNFSNQNIQNQNNQNQKNDNIFDGLLKF
jgi:hypothetical protein